MRLDLREGKSLSQIGRDRGISRTTVRKIRDSRLTEFVYERSQEKQLHPVLGRWHEELSRMLEEEWKLPAGRRRKRTRLHEDLQSQGPTKEIPSPPGTEGEGQDEVGKFGSQRIQTQST